MQLTTTQQQTVCENLGLVHKVMQDRLHGPFPQGIFTYDDLFQIGCIGLIKAVATDRGGVFSTYAYRLIWHEICDALVYASRRSDRELATDPQILCPADPEVHFPDDVPELTRILEQAELSAKGVVAKGIRAIRLQADGYTCREIGERMGANDKNVAAWIYKARKHLKRDPALLGLFSPS